MDKFDNDVYLQVKDPNNNDIKILVPFCLCSGRFEDYIQIDYNGLNYSTLTPSEELRYRKDFAINVHTLDEEREKEVLEAVRMIKRTQDNIDKIQKKIEDLQVELEWKEQHLQKDAQKLSNLVFNVAFEHKGISVNSNDLKVGDIYLTIDYKLGTTSHNWDYVYLRVWTVTKLKEDCLPWVERIEVCESVNDKKMHVDIYTEQWELIDIIKRSNEAYKITKDQYKKIKTRIIDATCTEGYRQFIQDIRDEVSKQFEGK